MENRRKRCQCALKNKIQDFWNDYINIIIFGLMILLSIGIVVLITTIIDPHYNEKVKSQTQDYIEIQLGDDYQLAAWDYDYFNCPLIPYALINVEVSYIGINNKTGKKKEVIEEDVSLSKIAEVIAKEEKKKRLEKQMKNKN
ncbi:hypothetical protein [Listeria monocytogenes]|uniref:hypothetical protein n=1 Tax=Listeria monocytogenes TaxID=1639 RepID=UPI0029865F6C|nr:hypothetical protein [Listeria monocytogenes]EAE9169127.1 hypothetical protein [Listeria monocytogenes]EAF9608926.1 hypothetical protein [Listeria monocytogenes]MEB2463089.1 hypothetical protein [Listeria monocytogenes]